MRRGLDVLRTAQEVLAERAENYGDPRVNAERIARLMTAILEEKLNAPIRAEDVPLLMVAVKMSRLIETPHHVDSIVDIAGYAAYLANLDASAPTNNDRKGA